MRGGNEWEIKGLLESFSLFFTPQIYTKEREEESSCKAPAPCCAASHGSKDWDQRFPYYWSK